MTKTKDIQGLITIEKARMQADIPVNFTNLG